MMVYFSSNEPFDNLELNRFHFFRTQTKRHIVTKKNAVVYIASPYYVLLYDEHGREKWLVDITSVTFRTERRLYGIIKGSGRTTQGLVCLWETSIITDKPDTITM